MFLRLLYTAILACALTSAGTGKAATPAVDAIDPTELAAAAASAAAQGWIDLMRDPSLADWERLPLPAGTALAARNPWRFDASTGHLQCDGTGLHELLLHRVPRGDGIFRVEWRFVGAPAKPNAAVWVRTTPDLTTSHCAPLAPPFIGSLAGSRPAPGGGTRRLNIGSRRANLLRKAEEWNVLELVCIGSRLTLHCNGAITADWNECSVSSGRLGLETDGTPVEFRTIRFKPVR